MFSLIITIISIALVAALALATLYYGGNAFNQGTAKAQASKLSNQIQQLQGAADLFKAQTGRYPDDMAELVSGQYLKTVPVAQGGTSEAFAAAEWTIVMPGVPLFQLYKPGTEMDLATCATFNEANSLKRKGVFYRPHDALTAQCFGTTTNLYVIAQKTPGNLQTYWNPTTLIPADYQLPLLSTPGWTLFPVETN